MVAMVALPRPIVALPRHSRNRIPWRKTDIDLRSGRRRFDEQGACRVRDASRRPRFMPGGARGPQAIGLKRVVRDDVSRASSQESVHGGEMASEAAVRDAFLQQGGRTRRADQHVPHSARMVLLGRAGRSSERAIGRAQSADHAGARGRRRKSREGRRVVDNAARKATTSLRLPLSGSWIRKSPDRATGDRNSCESRYEGPYRCAEPVRSWKELSSIGSTKRTAFGGSSTGATPSNIASKPG